MDRRTRLLSMVGALALCLMSCTSTQPIESVQESVDVSGATGPGVPALEEPAVVRDEGEVAREVPIGPVGRDEELLWFPERVFARATVALSDLASYRFTTLLTFVGEDDGAVSSGSIEVAGVVVTDPRRLHLVWKDLAEGTVSEVIRVDDEAWIAEDGAWRSVSVVDADVMSQAVLIYTPTISWTGILGALQSTAQYAGRATVSGVSAHHYTSTYAQWGGYWASKLTNASGDVWIAEAGYPLRFHFTAIGTNNVGKPGQVTWRMDLCDIDEAFVIESPL